MEDDAPSLLFEMSATATSSPSDTPTRSTAMADFLAMVAKGRGVSGSLSGVRKITN